MGRMWVCEVGQIGDSAYTKPERFSIVWVSEALEHKKPKGFSSGAEPYIIRSIHYG